MGFDLNAFGGAGPNIVGGNQDIGKNIFGGPNKDYTISSQSGDKDLHKLEGAHTDPSTTILKFPNDLGQAEFGDGHYISFQVMKADGIHFNHESHGHDNPNEIVSQPGTEFSQQEGPVYDQGYFKAGTSSLATETWPKTKGLAQSIWNNQNLRNAVDVGWNSGVWGDQNKYSLANRGKTTVRFPALIPQESVFLYIPGTLEAEYSANYQSTSLAAVKTLGDLWTAYQGYAHSDLTKRQAAQAGEIGRLTLMHQSFKALDAIPNIIGFNSNFESAAEAILREVPNPHMEMLFKGVGFRKFNFQFLFYPRNEQEAIAVFNIIRTFKLNSMPALSYGGRFLEYPNEFRIRVFSADGEENKFVHEFLPCACEDVRVAYGNEGAFTTFERIPALNGSCPTKIHLSLSFTELSLLDRNKMEEGNY